MLTNDVLAQGGALERTTSLLSQQNGFDPEFQYASKRDWNFDNVQANNFVTNQFENRHIDFDVKSFASNEKLVVISCVG